MPDAFTHPVSTKSGQGHLETIRILAIRPFSEVEHTLGQARRTSTTGINKFNRLNHSVTSLCKNFARLEDLGSKLIGHEGEIPELNHDTMSSANLQVFKLLGGLEIDKSPPPLLVHVEEPELCLHPTLQKSVVREILLRSQKKNISLSIETHSPFVLSELIANEVPCYRVHVVEIDEGTNTRKSEATPLAKSRDTMDALREIGVDPAMAALGGVAILTDGPTDGPVYQQFFSKFPEIYLIPICCIPIGCMEAKQIELKAFRDLSPNVILVADGHFKQQSRLGERLKEKCDEAEIEHLELLTFA